MLEFRPAEMEDLKEDALARIAELTYDTDPYIYPAMVLDKRQGIIIFGEVFKDIRDNFFDWKKIYLMIYNNNIIGLIMWNKSSFRWDRTAFLDAANRFGFLLPDSFQQVCQEYMSSYENERLQNKMSIINVCVLKEYQGKGYGKLMMDHFMAYFHENSYELYCLADNLPAMKLYASCGFKIVKKQTAFLASDPDIYTVKMEYCE